MAASIACAGLRSPVWNRFQMRAPYTTRAGQRQASGRKPRFAVQDAISPGDAAAMAAAGWRAGRARADDIVYIRRAGREAPASAPDEPVPASKKKPTIATVAAQAGVAVSTVSRYLNGHYVSRSVRARLSEVIETLGYSRSWTARNLSLGRKRLHRRGGRHHRGSLVHAAPDRHRGGALDPRHQPDAREPRAARPLRLAHRARLDPRPPHRRPDRAQVVAPRAAAARGRRRDPDSHRARGAARRRELRRRHARATT